MDQINSLHIPRSALIILLCIFAGLTLGIALDFNLAIPVILFGGIGLFILFNERPLVFLALLIVARMSLDYSSQFVTVSVRDYTLSLSQILGLAIALLGGYLIYLYRDRQTSFPLNRSFLIIILWGLGTLIYSMAPGVSLTEVIRIFDLYVIALLGYLFVRNREDLRTLLVALLASSILPGLVAIYQYVNHIGFIDADVSIPRIYGTFAHPNTLSLYLFSLLVVCLLYQRLTLNTKQTNTSLHPVFSVLLFCLLGLLFLTFARVAWVVTFLFILSLTFFRNPRLLIPLILVPLVLVLLSTPFQERIAESFSPSPDSSIVWRQTLWTDVITKNIQDDRILLGSGINTFPLFTDTLRESVPGSNDAHNDWVKFYIEGGILGLVVLAVFYLHILREIYRLKKTHPDTFIQDATLILFIFTGCLLLASLSDNVFKNTPVQWIYFVLLGSFLGLTSKKPSEKN